MVGDIEGAERRLDAQEPGSRLGDEVAVMVGREDLIDPDASPVVRARSAWSRGDLHASVEILENAGRASSLYAQRLRSDLRLLSPGYRLPVTPHPVDETRGPGPEEHLRVLHLVTNSLPHTQSGYSLRTHRILRALRDEGVESLALTRTGYPVMVGLAWARSEDVVDGIRYARTLPRSLPRTPQERLIAEVEHALQLVDEFRPHVIHATTNYMNALVAQAVSEATGLPWVLEVRGLMEQTWIASRRTEQDRTEAAASEKVALVAAREGELAREADAVVTLSEAMAGELQRRGVAREAITLVPNGVEADLFDDDLSPAEARERVGLDVPSGAVLVGAVSALVEYEGFETLLRAAARIIHGDEPLGERLHVLLAGDGVAAPGLTALADDLGIAGRLHMPGRVPREDSARWVQALDIVTVPRLDREVSRSVTPQKPVEALALGRPVVVSDLPALRETVVDREGTIQGVLVPAGDVDALANALRDLDLGHAAKSAAAGRDLVRERSWPALVGRYKQLYDRAVGS
ncbi:glycosyltransferase [Brachybacterium sp. YJGR34]|uniref:glycosyltransferase n=1 Tax=Brachybacterium sp. YJGR34 TaxID=2059911 RepID=UPI0018E5F071|nr:glycosyltransferase [Brachybacterium sp. YJGR34]